MPRPDSPVTAREVEKPGLKIRRASSSGAAAAASASDSNPDRTATSATFAMVDAAAIVLDHDL